MPFIQFCHLIKLYDSLTYGRTRIQYDLGICSFSYNGYNYPPLYLYHNCDEDIEIMFKFFLPQAIKIQDSWLEYQARKRCLWDPALLIAKMRRAREVKVSDRMRNFLDDAHQVDLLERFSKRKHLEAPQASKGDQKEQYVDFQLVEFWSKFHKLRKKTKEKVAATGTAMPDELHLMAIVAGDLSRIHLFGGG
ncbi:hypothetical protein M9H77_07859 [Catharanthus roseus]|uniref:Uncharacterized protein n=1 Tax=Catharanthus roseus TaxID=4058 RepID=A0ACC0BW37_CATRO|nr:hypothetical protein M9H77_07859 [Catharanthus roseus]